MMTSDVIKERLKQVESREDRIDKLESEFIALASQAFFPMPLISPVPEERSG